MSFDRVNRMAVRTWWVPFVAALAATVAAPCMWIMSITTNDTILATGMGSVTVPAHNGKLMLYQINTRELRCDATNGAHATTSVTMFSSRSASFDGSVWQKVGGVLDASGGTTITCTPTTQLMVATNDHFRWKSLAIGLSIGAVFLWGWAIFTRAAFPRRGR